MPEIMLADRIAEAGQTFPIKSMRDEFSYVAAKIRSAQRFHVSDDVRGAIRSLLTSKPSTLIEAARFARLPFERCWFEWAAPYEANLHANQIQVRRCGALLEAYGPHGFTMFTAWEFDRRARGLEIAAAVKRQLGDIDPSEIDPRFLPDFGVSALVGAYDFSSFTLPALMDSDRRHRWFHQRELTLKDLAQQRDDLRNGVRHALADEKEWQAIRTLSERSCFRIHSEVHGERKINDQEMLTGDTSSIVHDVQDEMGHLFATLILMNSKNCVEVAKTEPPMKLNKARSKRGKPELLPYSTVKIELSQSQKRAVASGLISREEARRHLVRGHFKVRSTGVFWWGEFIRGSAAKGTIERRVHLVEAGNG
jgi:hypothetical protein